MRRSAYTYVVLRYAHDPTSGEALNIGVLLYAPEASFVDVMFEHTFSRLSAAFAGFDGRSYHRVISEFGRGVERIRDVITQRSLYRSEFLDAASIAARLWPDNGLSFKAGGMLAGVTQDLPETMRRLFEKFVASQFTRYESKRRDDDDVWRAVEARFTPKAADLLVEAHIRTKYGQHTFKHTFRNQHLHVIEPWSLDYAQPTQMIEMATRWRGRLDVIRDNSDESDCLFHLIVGPPKSEYASDADHAIQMIKDSRLKPQVHRENIEAPLFALSISDYILKHDLNS